MEPRTPNQRDSTLFRAAEQGQSSIHANDVLTGTARTILATGGGVLDVVRVLPTVFPGVDPNEIPVGSPDLVKSAIAEIMVLASMSVTDDEEQSDLERFLIALLDGWPALGNSALGACENMGVDALRLWNVQSLQALPEGLCVGEEGKNDGINGHLDLAGCKALKTLPENMFIEGHLDLKGAGIKRLPNKMFVGTDLYLNECEDWDGIIPKGVKIDGHITTDATPFPGIKIGEWRKRFGVGSCFARKG